MRIVKQKRQQYGEKSDMFGRFAFTSIKVSSAVRDAWLPHRFVHVEMEGNKVMLRPTDDKTGYRLYVSKTNQMMFGWCYADRFAKLPQRTRLPISEIKPGLYLMEVPILDGGSDG